MSQPSPIAEVLNGFVISIEPIPRPSIGSNLIKLARHRRSLGIREFAELARVPIGTARYWETSEEKGTIRRATLERALKAMFTTPEEVLAEIVSNRSP